MRSCAFAPQVAVTQPSFQNDWPGPEKKSRAPNSVCMPMTFQPLLACANASSNQRWCCTRKRRKNPGSSHLAHVAGSTLLEPGFGHACRLAEKYDAVGQQSIETLKLDYTKPYGGVNAHFGVAPESRERSREHRCTNRGMCA